MLCAVPLVLGAWIAWTIAKAETAGPAGGREVVRSESILTTTVYGLERTNSTTGVVPVSAQSFNRARRVIIGTTADETNATQATLMNEVRVEEGDVLVATVSVRGSSRDSDPARGELLFEKSSSPWTKSITHPLIAGPGGSWRVNQVAFRSAATYEPGEAMLSIRMAFGPQTLDLGGLSLVNFGKSRSLEEVIAYVLARSPVNQTTTIHRDKPLQRIVGFGGNFCQPRYGSVEPMDRVGEFVLENLDVRLARVGITLERWAPEPGRYVDDAQARATFLAMQRLKAKGIPLVASVWEGPEWLLPGPMGQNGRVLPRDRYDEAVEAIAQFLWTAKTKYGAEADYFSFNEPDYGVHYRFSPEQMVEFIRIAGPRFRELGLNTKFIVADTASGANFAEYSRPILEAADIQQFLGPLAFHSWDALSAPAAAYRAIAEVGRRSGKPIWCLEAGHDAQLWQTPNPWHTWDNAFRTALAYERTLRLSGAEIMAYWTYQNNYPLVDEATQEPFPVFHVMRKMEAVYAPGSRLVETDAGDAEVRVSATIGPDEGRMAVLIVNTSGPGRLVLRGLPANARFTVLVSDSESVERSAPTLRVDPQGRATVELGARSVITLRTP